MDYVDYTRFKIIKVKTVKITATDLTTNGGWVLLEVGSGQLSAKPDELRQTQASKIVAMNIPGAVFGPGGQTLHMSQAETPKNSMNIQFMFWRIIASSRIAKVSPPALAGE